MLPAQLRPMSALPPALNVVALATFAASLSARALDPVLPRIAGDFNVSITTAAGFASRPRTRYQAHTCNSTGHYPAALVAS